MKKYIAFLGIVFLLPFVAFAVVPVSDDVDVAGWLNVQGSIKPQNSIEWSRTGVTFMGINTQTLAHFLNYPNGRLFMNNDGELFHTSGLPLVDMFGTIYGQNVIATQNITGRKIIIQSGANHFGAIPCYWTGGELGHFDLLSGQCVQN